MRQITAPNVLVCVHEQGTSIVYLVQWSVHVHVLLTHRERERERERERVEPKERRERKRERPHVHRNDSTRTYAT